MKGGAETGVGAVLEERWSAQIECESVQQGVAGGVEGLQVGCWIANRRDEEGRCHVF